jgi:hypothetical protein
MFVLNKAARHPLLEGRFAIFESVEVGKLNLPSITEAFGPRSMRGDR